MTDDVLLTILIVLPFVGSLLAATFRPNARNSEAWLAGGAALVCRCIRADAIRPGTSRTPQAARFRRLMFHHPRRAH